MTQWRDTGTDTNTNNNMWPYTVRLLQQKAVEKGCEYIYGAQGLTLVHENGKVTGAIFTDIDGKYFQVNADAVIVAAGDFGGNPDMRLDLCDTLRNLAWSYGKDRTDVNNVSSMGRDGSGIRMMLWAGATMEAGPRAGQAAGTYTASKNSGYSTVTVTMTFSEDAITDCKITSSGNDDLMKDDLRSSMAAAVVDSQGDTSVDAITSSTLSFSVKAVQEAVADCIAQAKA